MKKTKNVGRACGFRIMTVILMTALLSAGFLTGCGNKSETVRTVKIDFLKYENAGNSIAEIPQFVTESGEETDEIKRLNNEIKFLQNLYEDTTERNDGSYVEIRSYLSDTKRFLQVTTTYVKYPIEGSQGDLVTFAYDTETDTGITPTDALKMSGIASDELSIDVHDAYLASGGNEEITSTEMQGFELADDGTLKAIYMKLGLFDAETETETQIFCRFVPEDKSLSIKDFGEGMTGGLTDVSDN